MKIIVLALALVMTMELSLCARTWTDRAGQTLEASFVRVLPGVVVVKRDTTGAVMTVPFASLSGEDQDYVRQQLAKKKIEEWTFKNGDVFFAKFTKRDGPRVLFFREGKREMVMLAALSAESQDRVAQRIAGTGPPPVGAASNRADTNPDPPNVDTLGQRQWTDSLGRKMIAKYVSSNAGQVILKAADKQISVPIATLSALDQDYVRLRSELETNAKQLAGVNESFQAGADKDQSEIDHPGPTRFTVPTKPNDAPRRRPPSGVSNPPVGASRTSSRPSFVNDPDPRPASVERYNVPAPKKEKDLTIAMPSRAVIARPEFPELVQHFCSNCNEKVPDNLRVGDRCPHCGHVFDRIEEKEAAEIFTTGTKWGIFGGFVGLCAVFIVAKFLFS